MAWKYSIMLYLKLQLTMVRLLFKKGLNAIASKQANIFSAAFFIIITTIFSQILGFLKYRLLVSIFGASSDLGVFLASFRIPDFLFQIVIAGALSSAFIPIFSEYLSKEKREEAYSFTSSLITIGITLFVIISILISIFAYPLSSLIAPGFSQKELTLMADLTRILLLTQIFFILGTLVTAILQSFQHFIIPGVASSFYNLGIIIGLLVFTPILGIHGAVIGVLLGSLLFFVVQLPLLKTVGFRFTPKFNIESGVMRIFHLMIPRSLTLLVTQIAITANVAFASFISARALVIFDLAQSLVMAPVVLFGQSIAQASFPSLSLKHNNREEFLYIFLSSFTQILYLTFPISAILIVLRIPIVRLFYGAKGFDWFATVDTGKTLAFFAICIFAQALMYLLSRAFFALKDTKTPFIVTLVSVIFNIVSAYYFILILKLQIYYLALSFSVASIFSVVVLIVLLDRKIIIPKLQILYEVSKIALATLVMGFALYIPIKLLDQLVFDTTRTINLIALTGIASFFGLTAYIFFTWLLDIKEAYFVLSVFKKFGNGKNILKQIGELIDGSTKLNP